MALTNCNPLNTKAWSKLLNHFQTIQNVSMTELFANDPQRTEQFHVNWDAVLFDYSKNRIDATTRQLLVELAEESGLQDAIQKYFNGDLINVTENRAVLHTALRSKESVLKVCGINIMPEIKEVQNRIKSFSEGIISGKLKGHTGKPFTDVVNIGIGGSDLGPDMAVEALKFYKNHLKLHFVSNVDGDHVAEVLKELNPETTLFIVVSKTFTTQETRTNADTIKKWFLQTAKENDIAKHFIAVSTNIEKAKAFGISEVNIFPMWDWVGGRFSLWSAVGISIALAVGYEHFESMLNGAHKMDTHFKTADFNQNIPVLLALLGIWYANFFNSQTEAVIPYTQYLNKFSTYLQQAVMESNGKRIDRDGIPVAYSTGSIIWGEPGTNSQHAFFQLIHQGTQMIPCDFIGFKKGLHGNEEHHHKLMSNFFAQTEALMLGKDKSKVLQECAQNPFLVPFKTFEGNKPTNTLLFEKLTPESLGMLLAMYEHKIFVQGVIWNIFSFDQFGVEYGKELATTILNEIQDKKPQHHDASTEFLIRHYMK